MIGLAQPLGLLVLLALVPMAVLATHALRARRRLDAAAGGAPALRHGLRPRRRAVLEVLLAASVVFAAIAIARPTWGTAETPLTRTGIDIAIALDISRSMEATDIAPTRAQAAATGLDRLLEATTGDRVGLVTFAGTAFQRSPLTLDLDVVSQLIRQAQAEVPLVQQGTDLAAAIEAAVTLLDVEDRADSQVVVLVSDGEHVGRDLEFAIRRAQDLGIRVYTVAAGTEDGGDLPPTDEPGGETGVTRLDRATLQRIAEETGGNARDLDAVAGLAVEFSRLRQSELATTDEEQPIERFQWFLGGAIALLILRELLAGAGGRPSGSGDTKPVAAPRRRRRGAVAAGAAATALLLGACGGTAVYQYVRDGNDHYRAGEYEEALAAYRRAATEAPDDPVITYDTGNALHQLGRFEEASVASAAAVEGAETLEVQQHATYALGSHAFERGDLETARTSYMDVLRRDPTNEDARYNLELVLLLMREAEQPPSPPDTPPGSGEGDSGGQTGPEATPTESGGGAGSPGAETTPEPNEGGGQAPGGGGTGEGSGGSQGTGPTDPQGPSTNPGAGGSDGGVGGTGAGQAESTAPLSADEARALLEEALAGLGQDVTPEEALAILDQLRNLNAVSPLEGGGGAGGTLPDR
ncbi:MAG: VWA domain-containing protein [Dehalococcoidia bacterium]